RQASAFAGRGLHKCIVAGSRERRCEAAADAPLYAGFGSRARTPARARARCSSRLRERPRPARRMPPGSAPATADSGRRSFVVATLLAREDTALACLALAVIVDQVAGEPPAACHPVVAMGRAIAAAERRAPRAQPAAELALGALVAVGGAAAI